LGLKKCAKEINTDVVCDLDWFSQKGKFVENEPRQILALPSESS
jgi:hypothetical protein